MAKGGAIAACGLRIAFLCALPVGASLLGFPPGALSYVLSIMASIAEVCLFVMRTRNYSGKRRHSIRPAGFFPLQLLGLYMVQVWLVMFLGSAPEVPAASISAPSPTPPVAEPDVASAPQSLRGQSQPSTLSQADQGGFDLDAPLSTLSWHPKTISVVLPCAEEREYALKTVESVFSSTPSDVLHEIVVVDDGSRPPLSETVLGKEVCAKYRVRIERHEQTRGLIGAKKTGGDVATGDIVVFFDCHVAPQPNWHTDFLTLISENYRRMVVPHITALDVHTWTQMGGGGGLAKCYLTWDADFKWVDSSDRYIPVISGGLLGMSRRWWQETGGYDVEMLGWGGENLDQSLRVWLCGGEIVMAPKAEVAHMWRDGTKETQARYRHVGDTERNRARAVYAWYGDFAKKLQDYPHFASRRAGSDGVPWYGDLSAFDAVRSSLGGCRPFAWFLHRFRDIYVDGGLLPGEIFKLREDSSGMCLRFEGGAGTSQTGEGSAALSPCDAKDDRLFWHLGNTDRATRKCCSGLHAWNTDQCFTGARADGKVETGVCSVGGLDGRQEWSLTSAGQLLRGSTCMGVSSAGQRIVSGACLSFRGKSGGKWTKLEARVPLETELYHAAMRDHPELFAKSLSRR